MKLSSKLISSLNGKPIKLTSDYADGKVLTIDKNGDVYLDESHHQGDDQYWKLIPGEDGFLISSSVDGYQICHHSGDGGNIKTNRDANNDSCVWKVGKGGEFYQKALKDERYLWLAKDKLYTTLDGYLAESWIPLEVGDELPDLDTSHNINKTFLTIIIVATLTMVLYLLYSNRPKRVHFSI